VRGQLCVTASLFPVKEPPVHIDKEAEGGPRSGQDTGGERSAAPAKN